MYLLENPPESTTNNINAAIHMATYMTHLVERN